MFPRYANFIQLIKQSMAYARISLLLEPSYLYITDNKRTDDFYLYHGREN